MMAATSQSITQSIVHPADNNIEDEIIEIGSTDPELVEEVSIRGSDSGFNPPADSSKLSQTTTSDSPSNAQASNPVAVTNNTPNLLDTPSKTLKQKQKEEEKLQRLKQRELEKQERDRAKEEERLQKEKLRKEKEEERRRINDEKERIKREKKEKLLEEKRERDKKKEVERLKKEEEKLKKLEEKRKAEEEKKKEEEEKQKKATKLQISNFFKAKTTLKSTFAPSGTDTADTVDAADADYRSSFKDFYLRDTIKLKKGPALCDLDDFNQQMKTPTTSLKDWFKQKEGNTAKECTTAKYIFEHQLDAAPLEFRFIRFYENIKTYIGSYTKQSAAAIATSPFLVTESFIDWDEEENENDEGEGEDIDDEDDEEEEDEDMGDLSDFLDQDVDETKNKRKSLGPLVPIIQWHGIVGYKIECLRPSLEAIDPFIDYWKTTSSDVTDGNSDTINESPKPKKSKSLITSKEDLKKFAEQVDDSDFTLPTIVDLLKRQLPSYTKLTIENTLKSYAKKVGPKATEKKWKVDMDSLQRAMEL